MTKYILWDNDGVLVDTEYWYFKACQRALAELGAELTKQEYILNMVQGGAYWRLAREVGASEEQIEEKRKARNKYYQEFLRTEDIEIPGVIDVLKTLSKSYRMAIITTSRREDFDIIHKDRGILPFMGFVIAREDYVNAKPDPEPYLAGLSKFGASPDEAIIVEDSQRGLQSAVAAGIDCTIVHNEFTQTHDFTGAKHFIQTLAELQELLHT